MINTQQAHLVGREKLQARQDVYFLFLFLSTELIQICLVILQSACLVAAERQWHYLHVLFLVIAPSAHRSKY
jgi:hypothetical protein